MLDRVRSFLAILEEGSVNRAARRLGVAQPTLSRHIQSLEQEIGGSLFERGSWGMRPTDLGFFMRDRFKPLLAAYDTARADLHAFVLGRHKQLRIGYIGLAAAKYLNPTLAQLRPEFPDLKLLLLDQTPAEQLSGLREGRLDVALVGQEVAALANDFFQRRVARLRVCAVLSVDHSLADKSSIPLSSLAGDAFIGVAEDAVPGRNQWMTGLCTQAGFLPRFIAHTHEVSETFTLITSERAVTLLPDYLASPPPPGTAVLRIADCWAHWDLHLLRQRGRGSQTARRLVEVMVALNRQVV